MHASKPILQCAAFAFGVALAVLPWTAHGQAGEPARLEAINDAIEEANAAARRAAAAAGQSQAVAPDARPRPGGGGIMGPAPKAYPAGVAGPARPAGPGGKSRSPAKE